MLFEVYMRKDRIFLFLLSGSHGGGGGQRAFAAFCLMDRAEEAVGVTGWDSTCWRGKKPSERKEPMATDHLSLKKHLWVCQVRDLDSLPDRFCLIRSKTQC